MTASAAEARARCARGPASAARPVRLPGAALLVVGLSLAACSTPSAPPPGSPLAPPATTSLRPPDAVDRSAAELAARALVSDRAGAERALEGLAAAEAERAGKGRARSGLVPLGQDLLNATLDDAIAYREASRQLLFRDDLAPELRARLEQTVADDPLRLAERRERDAFKRRWGGAYNTLVEPVGRSIVQSALLPVGLARALIELGLREHLGDELSVPERQALFHWRRFLAEHPDAPESDGLEDRVDEYQGRLNRTFRDRMVRGARRALERDDARLAHVLADRALRFMPEDEEALALRADASTRLRALRAAQARSLEAPAADAAPARARDLLLALLLPGGDVEGAATDLLDAAPGGPLADEARFARAVARADAAEESAAWDLLGDLAGESEERVNMARHARALVESPEQNPWRAFEEARADDRRDRYGWLALGSLAAGARDYDLPRPLEWLLALSGLASNVGSLPNRLLSYPWLHPWPFGRAAARHAEAYLERHPGGEHAGEAARWLRDLEERRGNFVGALRAARLDPEADAEDLAELSERAAEQMLAAAESETRVDYRAAMLRATVRDHPETEAGREAGERLRELAETATPQRIRLSRGFLLENPRVAGPEGLGLVPGLLDDDPANGELHPDGVAFVGGRVLELSFLGPGGSRSEPPEVRREEISDARLARTVALLDEVTRRNELLDPDERIEADAAREHFFERARLGIADQADPRARARSTYTFLGMRERYGLVRGRESILPVDLVLQGSLPDLGLGAFPRVRMPKPTPDAVLYQ